MRILKRSMKIISTALLTVLLVYIVSAAVWPKQTSQFIGYRFYTVLTDSMEPKIPTFSLVFSKLIDEDEPIAPNTIVTFQADRFGEDILLTHFFRKTQEKNGITYYRTQGATAKDYDNYETKRSDIIGVYLFHIPYLGKIFLFLKSPFGFIMYGELAVILMINRVIRTRWEEKDKEIVEKQEALEKLTIQMRRKLPITGVEAVIYMDDTLQLTATLTNRFAQPVYFVVARMSFYDAQKKEVYSQKWYLCGKEGVLPKESKTFSYTLPEAEEISHYQIEILSYKSKK